MGIEWAGTYFIIFLQVFAGLILIRAKIEPRLAGTILGFLFLFNAGVSAIMGLPREAALWFASDGGWASRTFRALDASTGGLLLADLAARSARPGAQRWARILVGAGIVLALAEFPFPRAMIESEYALRALPLYYGLGVGSYILAAGRPWERWLALALLSRAFYWSTAGVIDVARAGLGDSPHLFVNRLGLLALGAVALAATVRLALAEEKPPASVFIPVLIIGPAAAIIETGVSRALPPDDVFRYGSLVFANLLTLGLVRPILTLAGVAPSTLFPALARVALAAGIATLATLGMSPFRFGAAPLTDAAAAYGFGLCVGLLAVAALEAAPGFRLGRAGSYDPSRAETAGPPPEGPGGLASVEVSGGQGDLAGEPSRPQWQTILLALKGSSLPEGATAVGAESLTQRAVVERTGVRASRVSTLVRELNEESVTKLDAYLPGWRQRPEGRVTTPELIRQYRGAVPGLPGVWVYYRLTPLGEEMVRGLELAEFRQNSPAR